MAPKYIGLVFMGVDEIFGKENVMKAKPVKMQNTIKLIYAKTFK